MISKLLQLYIVEMGLKKVTVVQTQFVVAQPKGSVLCSFENCIYLLKFKKKSVQSNE